MLGLGIGLGACATRGIYHPTLDLDFTQGVLPPGLTFTRASTATYIGSDGLLKTAAVDQPRFDYDPITLACKGLLIEESRTNLLTYYSEFDNAAWTKSGATVTANAISAPNGLLEADKLVETATSAVHQVLQSQTVVSGTTYTASFRVKAAERGFALALLTNTGFSNHAVSVNLSTGAVTSAQGTPTNLKSENLGGGWWLVSFNAVAAASGAGQLTIYTSADGVWANRIYLGDGTSGIYIWGAGLQPGAFNTSVIPTVASAVTRAADVLTMTGLNFSRWFNPVEGTFVWEIGPSNGTVIGGVGDTFDNTQYATVSGNVIVRSGGVAQAQLIMTSLSAGGRVAWVYKANDFAASINGGAAAVDAGGAVPVSSLRLKIGSSPWNVGADAQLNGHIRRVRYYPRRLSNTLLQQLTAAA